MQDLLRFSLALIVVIFHYKHFATQTALSLPPEDYVPPFNDALEIFYTHGYHAVSIFFFLSGFMLSSNLPHPNSGRFDIRNFLVKRLARIYPAHLATLAMMVVIAVLVDILGFNRFITYNDNAVNLFASLTLLQGVGITRDISFNLPSWSLSVEFICYLLFALICFTTLKRRRIMFFIGLVLGASITETASDPNVDNLGTGLIFFFSGALFAQMNPTKKKAPLFNRTPKRLGLFSLSLLSFWASTHLALGPQKLVWIFITFPTLAIALTQVDSILDRAKYRRFQWFGLISFSIYIWHFPIQAIMFYSIEISGILGDRWYNSEMIFFLYIGLSLLTAHVSLVTVEKVGSRFIQTKYLRN